MRYVEVDTTYSLNVRAQTEGKPSRHRRKVAKHRVREGERQVNDRLRTARGDSRTLQRELRRYRAPSVPRSVGQIVTSFIPYLVGLFAMGAIAQVSYLLSF